MITTASASSQSDDDLDEAQLCTAVPVRNTFIDYPNLHPRRRIASAPCRGNQCESPKWNQVTTPTASLFFPPPFPLASLAPPGTLQAAARNRRGRAVTSVMTMGLGTSGLPTAG